MIRIENFHKLQEYLFCAGGNNKFVEKFLSLMEKTEAVSLVLVASRIFQDSVDTYEPFTSHILPSSYGSYDFPVLKSKLLAKEHEQNIKSTNEETVKPKSSKEADDERKRQKLEMIAQKIAALKKRSDK